MASGVVVEVHHFILLVSCPYGRDIIRRIAYKITILVIACRTGFSRDMHIPQVRFRARAVTGGGIEHVRNIPRGICLKRRYGLRLIVDNDITLGVFYFVICA